MAEDTAYELESVWAGADQEVERLRQQALISWDKESRHFQAWGLRDGMNVVEAGSGPGFVTAALLEHFPRLRVTALERDPAMIERAARYLAKWGDRVESVQASVTDTKLPAAQFDFAIARFLFVHLPEPVAAAAELRRVLRPQGRLAIVDCDDALAISEPPDHPEILAMFDRLRSQHAGQGGDRYVGRKLLKILRAAGYVNVTMEAAIVHSDEVGVEKLCPNDVPRMWVTAHERGEITQRELDLITQTNRAIRSPEGLMMHVILMACGEAP